MKMREGLFPSFPLLVHFQTGDSGILPNQRFQGYLIEQPKLHGKGPKRNESPHVKANKIGYRDVNLVRPLIVSDRLFVQVLFKPVFPLQQALR